MKRDNGKEIPDPWFEGGRPWLIQVVHLERRHDRQMQCRSSPQGYSGIAHGFRSGAIISYGYFFERAGLNEPCLFAGLDHLSCVEIPVLAQCLDRQSDRCDVFTSRDRVIYWTLEVLFVTG